ncbi:MAG TPA: hypothetical protein VGU69_08180 [Rhizomicrobium sp.]|nr:hypothetical protein [Rhizomicrobium sp.]
MKFALACFALLCCLSPASAAPDRVLFNIDLTRPFHTRTAWHFRVTRGPDQIDPDDGVNAAPYTVRFVNRLKPKCQQWAGIVLWRAAVVTPAQSTPLLVTGTHPDVITPGAMFMNTIVTVYDRRTDSFNRIFDNTSMGNHNEETRIVRHGPLAGDIVVADAFVDNRYHYGITVYRRTSPEHFTPIVKFTGKTTYNNGVSVPVIDSEMPSILQHIRKWKLAGARPVPAVASWCRSTDCPPPAPGPPARSNVR